MSANPRATFTSHDPFYNGGTDILVEFFEDGSATVALRRGRDETHRMWGPPYDLHDASVLRVTGGDTGRVAS